MPDLNALIDAALSKERAAIEQGRIFSGYSCFDSDGGDAWALVNGPGQPQMHVPCSQQMIAYGEASKEIDQARKMAHGPFLWFEHNGKSYIVDDPAVVAQIEAAEKPIDDLRTEMRALRDQQRELSRQLRQQVLQHRQVEIPKPDLSKEWADLNAAVASLKASKGNMISQQQLMQLQLKINEIQGRLSRAESGFYAQDSPWGAALSKLGKQEGELGAEQGRLGGEMARIAAGNQAKIGAIIAQSLRDGKAKPVH